MMAKVIGRSPRAELYLENDPEAFDNYALKELATIDALVRHSRADVVLFKSILDSQIARELLDRYDNAKAIWIFRPYWDVVNSSLRHFKNHYQDLDLMVHRPVEAGWRVQNVAEDDMALVRRFHAKGVSDESARALLWYLRNQLLFQQRLESDARVAVVNYDDIVKFPSARYPGIFAHLGLQFAPHFTSEVRATSVNRRARPAIDPEIAALCDPMLERLTGARAGQVAASAPSVTA